MSIRIEDLAKTDFGSVTIAGGRGIAPAQRIGDIIVGKRGITADTVVPYG